MTGLLLGGLGCEPVQAPPPLPSAVEQPERAAVHLAGDSVTTPLVERLARVFQVRERGQSILVDASIGPSGAGRALNDGVIDAALVAHPSNLPPPPNAVRVARTRVVVAVSRSGGAHQMSPGELARTLLAQRPSWPTGLPRRVLLRPPDDPLQLALGARMPVVGAALRSAFKQRIWPVYAQGHALRSALRVTPGALAITDVGSLGLHGLPVWIIKVGEPVFVDLWLRAGDDPPPRLKAFMQWLVGLEAQEMIRGLGYATPRDPRSPAPRGPTPRRPRGPR